MAAESRDYIILNHSDCGYSFSLVYFQFFTFSLPDVCFCDFLLLFCLLLLVNNVQMIPTVQCACAYTDMLVFNHFPSFV